MTRSIGNQLPDALRQLLDGADVAGREGLTFLLITTDDKDWPHLAMLSVGEALAIDQPDKVVARWQRTFDALRAA